MQVQFGKDIPTKKVQLQTPALLQQKEFYHKLFGISESYPRLPCRCTRLQIRGFWLIFAAFATQSLVCFLEVKFMQAFYCG